MIIYMIYDNASCKWWSTLSSAGIWASEQEDGQIYTSEDVVDYALLYIRAYHPNSRPTKVEFGIHSLVEHAMVNNWLWKGKAEHNAWLCGTKENGGGIVYDNGAWWGSIIIEHKSIFIGKSESKEELMEIISSKLNAYLEIWRNG